MRKLISSTFMSLNGVIGNPPDWTQEFDATAAAMALQQLERSHALLLGRYSYEMISKRMRAASGDYPAQGNAIRKYVFSSTLDAADWSNCTIVRGDAATAVAKLKTEGDDDLIIYGHGRL